MKILWITNTLFPDVCEALNIPTPVVGGWMYSGALALLESNKNIELGVAALYNGTYVKRMDINGIAYFLVPDKGSNKKYRPYLEACWSDIEQQFSPDVVHLHGTEYPHGLAYLKACGGTNAVVSIQGLVSIYERYYMGGIPNSEIKKNITLRDIFKNDTLYSQQKDMQVRGKMEQDTLRGVANIVGRTAWDKDHAWAVNPEATYHFCNETLRAAFYNHTWSFDACEKYSIFLSQAHYPIKGLQQVIKALPLVLKSYPQTKVYIAGSDFINGKGWRLNGFGKYIKNLIQKHNLARHIIFTGVLSEIEISERYLKSNVFVCPSSIENSPNSVGEAQLLGVPCIAAYVGGVTDMVAHNITGFVYRFEEHEMLASLVCKVFSDKNLSSDISVNAKQAAFARHNRQVNAQALDNIYKSICKK
jgi:glycosyltransferase involved in cell wall biosynthesis